MNTRLLSSGFAALGGVMLGITQAAAQQVPAVICNGLIGCGAPPENLILSGIIPAVGLVMIQLAGGLAVIFVVLAGMKMVTTGGEDEGAAAKKGIIFALGGLGVAVAAVPIVSFVTTEQYTDAGSDQLLLGVMAAAIRITLTLFNMIFIVVIIYGGTRMGISHGSADEFKKGISMVKWAVIGAIVVNLARALVQAVLNLQI